VRRSFFYTHNTKDIHKTTLLLKTLNYLYTTPYMTRIIALSPKKNTKTRPYKSKARLAAKQEMLAKKAGKTAKK